MSRTERKGTPTPVADLPGLVGQEIGVSRWITVDQARIDAFAEVTEDRQFIHIDPEAARATPFGGTIAHGFLTLSLLSAMTYDAVPPLEGVVMGVNYGFDKLRFLAPVLAGRIEAKARTTAVVLSGGNVDPSLFAAIIEDRFTPVA